jgi:hypothetical protein
MPAGRAKIAAASAADRAYGRKVSRSDEPGCQLWTAERLLREMPRLSLEQDDAVDPLGVEDWFFESMISDVWLCATERVVGVLIDLRTAECFEEENMAVLVMHSPTDLHWAMPPTVFTADRAGEVPRWNWPMSLRSSFAYDGEYVTASLGAGLSQGDDLVITAERAHLYAGTVAGLGEIPDMGFDDDDVISRRLPKWSNTIDVIGYWALPRNETPVHRQRAKYLRVVDD